jgi:hypothetical protein
MKKFFNVYILAIKYWLQGDPWELAYMNAKVIVRGFKDRKVRY